MSTYYVIVTNKGKEKDAAARAAGTPMPLYAQLALGDGGGASFDPLETQVSLVNEVWRGDVNRVFVHPTNDNWVVIEARVPAEAGPFDIREVGVYDTDGDFVVVGSQALTIKPDPASGSTKDLYVRIVCEITNAAEVIQLVDPTLVYLTQWHLAEHADRRDNPHNVTVGQIGAETPSGAQAKVNEHAGAENNPHNVTAAQAGAETPTGAQARVDEHAGAKNNPHAVTAAQAGADPAGTAVAGDNALRGAVADSYNTLEKIALKLNQIDAVLSSDDVTLDEVQEIIDYITDNAADITTLMSSKVNISSIVDNLLSSLSNSPLSANQGRLLKNLVDTKAEPLSGAITSHEHQRLASRNNYTINLNTLPDAVHCSGGMRVDFINNFSIGSQYRTVISMAASGDTGMTQLFFPYNSGTEEPIYVRNCNYNTNEWGPLRKMYDEAVDLGFPVGTKMVFVQAAAPVGWVLDTTASYNTAGLRIVTSSGGSTGGSSDAFATHSHSVASHSHGDTFAVAGHTLTLTEIPSHRHSFSGHYYDSSPYVAADLSKAGTNVGYTNYSGGGGAHSHGLTGVVSSGGGGSTGSFSPKYVNAIICAKES